MPVWPPSIGVCGCIGMRGTDDPDPCRYGRTNRLKVPPAGPVPAMAALKGGSLRLRPCDAADEDRLCDKCEPV